MSTIGEFRKQRRNANKHTERGLRLLSESVDRDGWIGALTVAADGETFDGSARLVTAQQDSQLEPIIVDSDGSRPVIVRRTDIATADDPKAKRLGVMANHVTATDWEPDAAVLAEIAKDDAVIAALAKEDARLAELLRGEAKQESKDAGELVDKATELQAKWNVQRGDVWLVGKHRVMCGDSTNAADVARLMGSERANFGFADPPYNLGIKYGDNTNDNKAGQAYFDFCVAFWNCLNSISDVVCITPGIANQGIWYQIEKPKWAGAWVKMNGQSRNAFGGTNKWEPILFWRTPFDRGIDVFEANNDYSESIKAEGEHPVAKPPELMKRLLERFCKGIALDVFCGAGTTLIACEQLGMAGRGLEIEPKFVSVTLERLAGLGLTPQRIGNVD